MALVGSAVLVNRRATRAELDYPPRGSFVTTDGVRLQVALAIALAHPDAIRGLVLASGYYFPTVRTDAARNPDP